MNTAVTHTAVLNNTDVPTEDNSSDVYIPVNSV